MAGITWSGSCATAPTPRSKWTTYLCSLETPQVIILVLILITVWSPTFDPVVGGASLALDVVSYRHRFSKISKMVNHRHRLDYNYANQSVVVLISGEEPGQEEEL